MRLVFAIQEPPGDFLVLRATLVEVLVPFPVCGQNIYPYQLIGDYYRGLLGALEPSKNFLWT